MSDTQALVALGWKAFFDRQLTASERELCMPARVSEVHRDRLIAIGETGELELAVSRLPADVERAPVVGDWLVVDRETGRVRRSLEPSSLFRRIKPGGRTRVQHIAANVDTLFIVSSCNEEYNPSRIERYLALSAEAGAEAVIVLTKADMAADPDAFRRKAAAMGPELCALAIDARSPESARLLEPWLTVGQTIALLGSSGTGKSTLLNTLAGQPIQKTGSVRHSDKRGRHTTTRRSLHVLGGGGVLIDTPGMRELQLAVSADSLPGAFADVDELAASCRFSDCRHEGEPGCAVTAAVADGTLDPRRLENYRKLTAEQRSAAALRGTSRLPQPGR